MSTSNLAGYLTVHEEQSWRHSSPSTAGLTFVKRSSCEEMLLNPSAPLTSKPSFSSTVEEGVEGLGVKREAPLRRIDCILGCLVVSR